MYNTLLIEDRGYVSVIEINRANKLNALGDDVRSDLLAAFKDFNSDPAKRIAILTGKGKAFSAGADLTSTSDKEVDIRDELSNSFHPILKEMVNSKKIFIPATGKQVGNLRKEYIINSIKQINMVPVERDNMYNPVKTY